MHVAGRRGPGVVRVGHGVLHQPHGGLLQVADRGFERPDELGHAVVFGLLATEGVQQLQVTADRPAAVLGQLAADQVQRLDAVGPLVDHGDAGVAHELLHAPFADVAVAAEDLLGVGGMGVGQVGEHALDHRGQQADQVVGLLALLLGLGALGQVDHQAAPQGQRARTLVERAGVHQHAAHVRVDDDRVGGPVRVFRPGQRAALDAVAGVVGGVLVGHHRLAQALDAHAQAGGVHHHEHGAQALVRLAQQVAGGAVVVQHAGGIAVDAHLLLDGAARHAVARAQRAVAVDQDLGHDEQRDALHPGRRVGQLGQHQMDDVLGHVVLAGGDEDLGAGDPVGVVVGGLGLGAHHPQVGAAVRLGQVHGARPFAGDHFRQVGGLLLVGAGAVQGGDGPVGQPRIHGERHVGRHHHLLQREAQHVGQALAAVFGIVRQALPAALDVLVVGFLKAGGRGHRAVVMAGAALVVARLVDRLQHVLAQLAAFLQDRGDQVRRGVLEAGQVGVALHLQHVVEQEGHVLDRGAIGGHGSVSLVRLSAGRGSGWGRISRLDVNSMRA